MNFEEMQNAWRSQGEGFKMTIDSSLLFHEVKRNHQYFSAIVFWRDFRECFVSFLLTAFFLYVGIKSQFLSLVFLAVTVAWVGAFIIGDRLRQKRKSKPEPISLRNTIEVSLQEVSHQVWLLKNVLWWYLLPPAVGMVVFYSAVLRIALPAVDIPIVRHSLIWIIGGILFAILVFWGVYKLNQAAVRQELLPRKRELEELLASLSEDS